MQLMEQRRADQTPRMELFSPTEYTDLQEVVRNALRPEELSSSRKIVLIDYFTSSYTYSTYFTFVLYFPTPRLVYLRTKQNRVEK